MSLAARLHSLKDLLPARTRIPPATSHVGRYFPHPEFYFWNGGLPPAFSSGISSRPRDPAYSTAGASFSGGLKAFAVAQIRRNSFPRWHQFSVQ